MKFTEDELEIFEGFRSTPEWEFVYERVAVPFLRERLRDILNGVEVGNSTLSQYNLGRRDGLLDFLAALYPAKVPEHLKELRR